LAVRDVQHSDRREIQLGSPRAGIRKANAEDAADGKLANPFDF
jgi:hypothetical protein